MMVAPHTQYSQAVETYIVEDCPVVHVERDDFIGDGELRTEEADLTVDCSRPTEKKELNHGRAGHQSGERLVTSVPEREVRRLEDQGDTISTGDYVTIEGTTYKIVSEDKSTRDIWVFTVQEYS